MKSNAPAPGQLLSISKAAKMAGVHRSTMYRRLIAWDKLHDGTLLIRSGKKLLVRQDVLVSLLSDHSSRVVTREEYDQLCEDMRGIENALKRRVNALGARVRELERRCKVVA